MGYLLRLFKNNKLSYKSISNFAESKFYQIKIMLYKSIIYQAFGLLRLS